jgi:predicted cupin superfamily sugar epimerase
MSKIIFEINNDFYEKLSTIRGKRKIDINTFAKEILEDVNNGEWYCGVQDEPLMKERGWCGSDFRTMLAAIYYMNEHQVITSDHVWYDKEGETHNYTLFDPDAEC